MRLWYTLQALQSQLQGQPTTAAINQQQQQLMQQSTQQVGKYLLHMWYALVYIWVDENIIV